LNDQVITQTNKRTGEKRTKKIKKLATAGTTPNPPIIMNWDFKNYKELIEYVVKLKNKTSDRIIKMAEEKMKK
jgi:hypothetical protein